MIKESPMQDYIERKDFDDWHLKKQAFFFEEDTFDKEHHCGHDDNCVDKYYKLAGYDTRVKITKDEFIDSFEISKEIAENDMFSIIPLFVCGWREHHLNLNEDDKGQI